MKWKERVGIAIAVGLVLLTSVLVLDIRYAEHQNQEPMLRHGTNRLKSGKHFQRQFLNEEQQQQHHQLEQQQQQTNVNGTYAEDQLDLATVSNPDDPLAMQRLAQNYYYYYYCYIMIVIAICGLIAFVISLESFMGYVFKTFTADGLFVCLVSSSILFLIIVPSMA